MSKIATGGGDGGKTSLFGGGRVSKAHPSVEAYGSIDELNAMLGLLAASPEADDDLVAWVRRVQRELFAIGAELATPGGGKTRIGRAHVATLEEELDALEGELPPLKTFVLPGGSELAARLHLARTVCRRAERRVIFLHEDAEGDAVRQDVRIYLNRLSDLLFLKARKAALDAGGEVPMDHGPFRVG